MSSEAMLLETTFDLSAWQNINFSAIAQEPPERSCGEFHWHINPLSGLLECTPWFCKDPYTCLICYDRKVHEVTEYLTNIADLGGCQLIAVDKPVTGQYGKELCLNLPHKTGIFALVKTDENIGIPFTHDMIEELAKLAIPPKNRRISGTLGKSKSISGGGAPPVELDLPLSESVNCLVWKITSKEGENIDNEIQQKVMNSAYISTLEQTIDLLPSDQEELQEAIKTVEDTFTKEILARGYDILFLYSESRAIIENKINWSHRKKKLIELKSKQI